MRRCSFSQLRAASENLLNGLKKGDRNWKAYITDDAYYDNEYIRDDELAESVTEWTWKMKRLRPGTNQFFTPLRKNKSRIANVLQLFRGPYCWSDYISSQIRDYHSRCTYENLSQQTTQFSSSTWAQIYSFAVTFENWKLIWNISLNCNFYSLQGKGFGCLSLTRIS